MKIKYFAVTENAEVIYVGKFSKYREVSAALSEINNDLDCTFLFNAEEIKELIRNLAPHLNLLNSD